MGACEFTTASKGATAQEAFISARDQAQWEHGHGGYSGTIAEKGSFVEIELPEGKSASEYADELMNNQDERVDDKWGPAGCIKVREGMYLFFGWASS